MKTFTLLQVVAVGCFGVLFMSPVIKTDEDQNSRQPFIQEQFLASSAVAAGFITPYQTAPDPGSGQKNFQMSAFNCLLNGFLMKENIQIAGAASASWQSIRSMFSAKEKTGMTVNARPVSTKAPEELVIKQVRRKPAPVSDEELSALVNRKPKYSFAAILTRKSETGEEGFDEDQLAAKIERLSRLAGKYGYSEEYAFLVNLGMKSGKKRFFVVNLNTGNIVIAGLVAHGRGKQKLTLDKQYSNNMGSGCSSLGLYRVGPSYYGGYGSTFKLDGLESSNSNASRRAIVLHAMNCIPDTEINYPVCQSEGCPAVSPNFFNALSRLIKGSSKPVLLWMFDPEEEN